MLDNLLLQLVQAPMEEAQFQKLMCEKLIRVKVHVFKTLL